jgi:hypothetical protein
MPLEDHPRRPAEEAPKVRLRREALALAEPFGKKLGRTQVQIAHLRGLAQRQLSPDWRSRLKLRADQLRLLLQEEQRSFDSAVAAAPVELRSHSALEDIRRALGNASASVDTVLAFLSGDPPER